MRINVRFSWLFLAILLFGSFLGLTVADSSQKGQYFEDDDDDLSMLKIEKTGTQAQDQSTSAVVPDTKTGAAGVTGLLGASQGSQASGTKSASTTTTGTSDSDDSEGADLAAALGGNVKEIEDSDENDAGLVLDDDDIAIATKDAPKSSSTSTSSTSTSSPSKTDTAAVTAAKKEEEEESVDDEVDIFGDNAKDLAMTDDEAKESEEEEEQKPGHKTTTSTSTQAATGGGSKISENSSSSNALTGQTQPSLDNSGLKSESSASSKDSGAVSKEEEKKKGQENSENLTNSAKSTEKVSTKSQEDEDYEEAYGLSDEDMEEEGDEMDVIEEEEEEEYLAGHTGDAATTTKSEPSLGDKSKSETSLASSETSSSLDKPSTPTSTGAKEDDKLSELKQVMGHSDSVTSDGKKSTSPDEDFFTGETSKGATSSQDPLPSTTATTATDATSSSSTTQPTTKESDSASTTSTTSKPTSTQQTFTGALSDEEAALSLNQQTQATEAAGTGGQAAQGAGMDEEEGSTSSGSTGPTQTTSAATSTEPTPTTTTTTTQPDPTPAATTTEDQGGFSNDLSSETSVTQTETSLDQAKQTTEATTKQEGEGKWDAFESLTGETSPTKTETSVQQEPEPVKTEPTFDELAAAVQSKPTTTSTYQTPYSVSRGHGHANHMNHGGSSSNYYSRSSYTSGGTQQAQTQTQTQTQLPDLSTGTAVTTSMDDPLMSTSEGDDTWGTYLGGMVDFSGSGSVLTSSYLFTMTVLTLGLGGVCACMRRGRVNWRSFLPAASRTPAVPASHSPKELSTSKLGEKESGAGAVHLKPHPPRSKSPKPVKKSPLKLGLGASKATAKEPLLPITQSKGQANTAPATTIQFVNNGKAGKSGWSDEEEEEGWGDGNDGWGGGDLALDIDSGGAVMTRGRGHETATGAVVHSRRADPIPTSAFNTYSTPAPATHKNVSDGWGDIDAEDNEGGIVQRASKSGGDGWDNDEDDGWGDAAPLPTNCKVGLAGTSSAIPVLGRDGGAVLKASEQVDRGKERVSPRGRGLVLSKGAKKA